MQTLRTGCSKVKPKNFAPPQTPFPGAWDSQNLISWRWSLLLPTDAVWWGSIYSISSYHGNRPTHKQTGRHLIWKPSYLLALTCKLFFGPISKYRVFGLPPWPHQSYRAWCELCALTVQRSWWWTVTSVIVRLTDSSKSYSSEEGCDAWCGSGHLQELVPCLCPRMHMLGLSLSTVISV